MYTRCLGSPHNPALVFLHGFMGGGEDWLIVAESLKQDFYCLLPDLPGHGATPLDADPGYVSWSAWLKAMLLDHGIERPYLVGYSLGGRLALYFCLTYPESVARLVLESTSPGISDPQARQQRAARDTALAERIQKDGLESFIREWYDLPLFASLDRRPGLKAELRRQRALQSPQSITAVVHALSPGRQPDLWANLTEIQVPTFLLTGCLDQKYTGITRRMAEAIPNSHMALLEECGHNVHRECSERYIEKLRDWLVLTSDN